MADRNNGLKTDGRVSEPSNALETSGPRAGESLFNWIVRTTREQAEAMQEKEHEKWIN